MWCEHCQKDVESTRSKSGQRMQCADCDREFEFEPVEHGTESRSTSESDWDDWQVDEDLRDARHLIELHSQNAMQLSRTTAGLKSKMNLQTDSSIPMAIPLDPTFNAKETANTKVAVEEVDARESVYSSLATANEVVAQYGWSPFMFAICGLFGGIVAMHVAQRWPQYFTFVLFVELGVGAMFAAILGKRRLMATGQAPQGLQ